MSEENTKGLTQDEKLDLILSRLTSVEGRLTALEKRQAALEAKVEERLHDTRPLWEVIHAQTEKLIEQNAQIVETLSKIESKLEVLTQDDKNDSN